MFIRKGPASESFRFASLHKFLRIEHYFTVPHVTISTMSYHAHGWALISRKQINTSTDFQRNFQLPFYFFFLILIFDKNTIDSGFFYSDLFLFFYLNLNFIYNFCSFILYIKFNFFSESNAFENHTPTRIRFWLNDWSQLADDILENKNVYIFFYTKHTAQKFIYEMETRSVIIMTIKLEVDLIKTKMAGDWVL